ncbi:mercury(II) reductase [uncultured Pseudonocardia sp.]|jgi:mercuric reductase|uniref:mercury(II) reductase n=1 Tax=uncultured Pseudonocardia sp. TaxID=211455 RepID=UPI00260DD449|nr:mercury(II) reductase [uncultured Pseudonocardia sp.]
MDDDNGQGRGGVEFDLAIVGSGGAGFAAAIAASSRGARVVMAERGTTGGTCVNTGCVPSKALLAAAGTRHGAATQAFPGIATSAGPVDMAALIAGKTALVAGLRTAKYTDLATEYGWPILHGTARFAATNDEATNDAATNDEATDDEATDDGPVLEVDLDEGGRRRIEAGHYLVATGSAPYAPGIEGLAGVDYLTSTTAMELDELPDSLVVIGAGYVGLEQAQLFAHLGARVTLVGRFAPHTEPELADLLAGVFTDDGITVVPDRATAVTDDDGTVVVTTTTGQRVRGARLLLAAGRRPVTAGLGLDAVGVKTGDLGEIVVDDRLRTTNPRIWAGGDVTGHPQYVYTAAAHGTLVADNALRGADRTLDYTHLPAVTFTTPALASAGLTEAAATAAGLDCDYRVLPLSAVPRALANRDTRGAIKLVAETGTGRLLGAHALAEGAGDVIAAAVYALANQMTVAQMAGLWCPYLTMAEGLKLAAQTFTTDVSTLSCCAA